MANQRKRKSLWRKVFKGKVSGFLGRANVLELSGGWQYRRAAEQRGTLDVGPTQNVEDVAGEVARVSCGARVFRETVVQRARHGAFDPGSAKINPGILSLKVRDA